MPFSFLHSFSDCLKVIYYHFNESKIDVFTAYISQYSSSSFHSIVLCTIEWARARLYAWCIYVRKSGMLWWLIVLIEVKHNSLLMISLCTCYCRCSYVFALLTKISHLSEPKKKSISFLSFFCALSWTFMCRVNCRSLIPSKWFF